MNYWKRNFADASNNYVLTAPQSSLVVSILSAGTFFGALLAAPTADYFGRRIGLMLSAGIVFVLGVILQTASSSRPMFIAGRCIAGLGVGLVSVIIPMYQSETAPKWIRGTVVGAYQLAITIGRIHRNHDLYESSLTGC
jgi:MFS transporter, SP family, sugar:H+ symporter